jgi:hypothetical protein
MKYEFIQIVDFINMPHESEIACLLKDAAKAFEGGYPEGAAWRIADASLLLRQKLRKTKGVCGIDEPTGRGALLGGPA